MTQHTAVSMIGSLNKLGSPNGPIQPTSKIGGSSGAPPLNAVKGPINAMDGKNDGDGK